MAGNNAINAVTSSSGWTSFTTTITSTGTAPTEGTGVTKSSYYIQVGKTLFIQFFYNQTGAGTAGTGDYLFNTPPGFTIDTTIVPTLNTFMSLGSCAAIGVANTGIGSVVIHDSTHYKLFMYANGTTVVANVGAAWFALSASNARYSAQVQLTIL